MVGFYHCAKQRMPESEAGKLCGRDSGLCGLLDEEAEQSKATFRSGYRRWATDAGERVLPQKRFSQWLEQRGSQSGFDKQHTKLGKRWVGLGLALAPASQGASDDEFD